MPSEAKAAPIDRRGSVGNMPRQAVVRVYVKSMGEDDTVMIRVGRREVMPETLACMIHELDLLYRVVNALGRKIQFIFQSQDGEVKTSRVPRYWE